MYAGLIKLGQKEHMQDLYRRGHLYLNTFDFFRQLEIGADGRAIQMSIFPNIIAVLQWQGLKLV